MDIESALFGYLSTYPGLVALIGTRIYPNRSPQPATYPLIVYDRISTVRQYSQSGASGLARPRFQFSCRGNTPAQARGVARQVRFALDGVRRTISGIRIVPLSDNELDTSDPETNIYYRNIDFLIWATEPVVEPETENGNEE